MLTVRACVCMWCTYCVAIFRYNISVCRLWQDLQQIQLALIWFWEHITGDVLMDRLYNNELISKAGSPVVRVHVIIIIIIWAINTD